MSDMTEPHLHRRRGAHDMSDYIPVDTLCVNCGLPLRAMRVPTEGEIEGLYNLRYIHDETGVTPSVGCNARRSRTADGQRRRTT